MFETIKKGKKQSQRSSGSGSHEALPDKLVENVLILSVVVLVTRFINIEVDLLVVVMGSMKGTFDKCPEPFNGVCMHLTIDILLLLVIDNTVRHYVRGGLVRLELVRHQLRTIRVDNILDES